MSEDGLGSVLMYRFEDGFKKPIAYESRTLSEAEKRYSNIVREALSIMFGARQKVPSICKWTNIYTYNKLQAPSKLGEARDLPKVMSNRLVGWVLEQMHFIASQ